jgi:hypothetical protein
MIWSPNLGHSMDMSVGVLLFTWIKWFCQIDLLHKFSSRHCNNSERLCFLIIWSPSDSSHLLNKEQVYCNCCEERFRNPVLRYAPLGWPPALIISYIPQSIMRSPVVKHVYNKRIRHCQTFLGWNCYSKVQTSHQPGLAQNRPFPT